MPWAMSSAFELWRSPVIESATTAESRLSTAARSATVSAAGSSGRIRSARNVGTTNRRKPARDATKPRPDRLNRQRRTAPPRPCRRRARRSTRARAAASVVPRARAPATPRRGRARAGSIVSMRVPIASMRAKNSLGGSVSERPRKSLIWVDAISSAMPFVKPITIGRGMNFTARAEPGGRQHHQDHASHHRDHEQPGQAMLSDDVGDDDDERAGRTADLDPRSAEQ